MVPRLPGRVHARHERLCLELRGVAEQRWGARRSQAATGEASDEESLSGSQMHASTTGLVEYLAEDDAHALELARDVIGRLDWPKHSRRARKPR